MSNSDRVLEFLRSITPERATNATIVARTGIRPHQQVFMISHELMRRGLIHGRQLGKEWEFWAPAEPGGQSSAVHEKDENQSRSSAHRRLMSADQLEMPASGPAKESELSVHLSGRKANVELTTSRLLVSGFEVAAKWVRDDEEIALDRTVPSGRAVYAFAVAGIVKYVGVAKLDLKRRLHGYRTPGPTQRTNIRIRPLIRSALEQGSEVEILIARPSDAEWSGLPVDQIAGLEAGLIRRFAPPWNVQGTSLQYVTIDDL